MMRQIVLDTETTGLDPAQDHRIIEIGCVELINRKQTGRHYHRYINPLRKIDEGAIEIHGITNEFLQDKPLFSDISDEFLAFIDDADLIIHNAPFDIGFLNHEFCKLQKQPVYIQNCNTVIDTLTLAKQKHPGQKNNLDALCKRYSVDNSQRELHGALLDAEILADVYLLMTGGQVSLIGDSVVANASGIATETNIQRLTKDRKPLKVIKASELELVNHNHKLDSIEKTHGKCIWRQLNQQ